MAVKVLSECRLIEIVLKHGQNSKGDKMNKMLTSTMCLIAVMSAMAMPTAKEQKAANARVKVIMSGFRDQSDSVQADLAMKASESAKTEGERFLLIRGAYNKRIKAGEYDKAALSLDALLFRVKDVPESLLRELLDKGLKDLPQGKADRLVEMKKALDEGRPRVIMMEPTNGSIDVSSKTRRITIWFDRPMSEGLSLCGNWPKPLTKPVFDESGKSISFDVQLEPGKYYSMSLNSKSHHGFKSAAGVTLNPFEYSFRVVK